jgi:Tol biopolymer transport system component
MLVGGCGRQVVSPSLAPTIPASDELIEEGLLPEPKDIPSQEEEIPPEPVVNPTVDEATLTEATALPPIVPDEGRSLIVFMSDFGGEDFELFVVEPSGENLTQLTDNDAQDFAPTWSPDGKMIAFHSDRDGNDELYVMNADGTNVIRLSADLASDTFPVWSPDGARIAFVSTRGGKADMWTVDIATAALTPLTDDTDDPANPDWSPDGTRIAFTAFRPDQGTGSVRVLPVETGVSAPITVDGAFYPDWSPDGLTIAFAAPGDGLDIFLAQADGSNPTPLNSNPEQQHSPSFSPDGTQLVYVQSSGTSSDLWVMNTDGTAATQITQGMNPLMPRWSSKPGSDG